MDVLERLQIEISRELYAQLPMRNESIGQADITGVAFAVAARISRGFRLEWAPDWDENPPEDDLISPDAARFHP
jgi:hypothetical protein